MRAFGTSTGDLQQLADWFERCDVRTVAMESTGVYWIPAYELLEQRGFEVVLVNARDAKHAPGRKTDVSDAQWLRRLHEYGLLRASFRPKGELAALRAYLRQRERLLDYSASHIQHMQKALMQMNVQLHHVVTDITGETGMSLSASACDAPRLWRSAGDALQQGEVDAIRESKSTTCASSACSKCCCMAALMSAAGPPSKSRCGRPSRPSPIASQASRRSAATGRVHNCARTACGSGSSA